MAGRMVAVIGRLGTYMTNDGGGRLIEACDYIL